MDGKIVDNLYMCWFEIDKSFFDINIKVMGFFLIFGICEVF